MTSRRRKHLRPVDPFELSEGDYDEKNIYTRATDDSGHKETFHTPVPPLLFAQVNQLANDIPWYRSPQDLVRDAIVHRVRWLTENQDDPELRRLFIPILMDANIAYEEEKQAANEAAVERLKKALQTSVVKQDESLREKVLEWAEGQVDEFREPYRSEIRKTIKEYKEKRSK